MKTAATREEWPLGVECAWPVTAPPRLAPGAAQYRRFGIWRTIRRVVRILLAQSGPRWAGRLGSPL